MNEPILSIFKTNTLIGIEVYDKRPVNNLIYQSSKKSWFFKREEGFRDTLPFSSVDNVYSQNDLETGVYCGIPLIVEENKAYQRPYVTFIFTEERKYTCYTKTLQDAINVAEDKRKEHIPYPESILFKVNR